MMRATVLAVLLLTAVAPLAVGQSRYLAESTTFAWNDNPNLDVVVEWAGIGGPGSDQGIGGIQEPNPDDCADLDDFESTSTTLRAIPSVSYDAHFEQQLSGGVSIADPAGIGALCHAVREALAPGFQPPFDNDPQLIGFGEVSLRNAWVFGHTGNIDTNTNAQFAILRDTFSAIYCKAQFTDTFVDGNEDQNQETAAGTVGPYAGRLVATVLDASTDCLDQTQEYLDEEDPANGVAWDLNEINSDGNTILNTYLVHEITTDAGLGHGLFVNCFRATTQNKADLQDFRLFEDYSWHWIDTVPPTFATSYSDIAHHDGQANNSDCDGDITGFPT